MKSRIVCMGLALVTLMYSASTGGVFDKNEKLSLDLESVSLPMVLNMIAKQYNLNVVLSGDVDGKVTVRLQDVDLQTALETILFPNGYNYYLKDNVIVVKPLANTALGELESQVITLKYLEPVTAKKALESMLSDKGTVVILDQTAAASSSSASDKYKPNRVLITDYPQMVEKMLAVIQQMDKQERLISIEVKLIETKLDNQTNLGLSWPTQIRSNLTTGTTTTGTSSTASTNTSTDQVAGSVNLNGGGWSWGTLNVEQLNAVLSLLESSGNSKLISDPHLTTLENHEAEIKIATVIPIPTVTRFTEGAATQDIQTFYDEEVGISLVVTPRISEDGQITLEVVPTVSDIIGYVGSQDSQKPVTSSRSVNTRITVQDGETAALGGLLKEDTIDKQQKVPFLGSIPLLGKIFFTSRSKEKSSTDLIILITPKIMP